MCRLPVMSLVSRESHGHSLDLFKLSPYSYRQVGLFFLIMVFKRTNLKSKRTNPWRIFYVTRIKI